MKQCAVRRALSGTVCLMTIAGLALSGCATASKNVATSYVSPLQYQAYDCEQLGAEAARIQSRVTALGGRLDEAAQNDAALTGIGLVLFWPALFFLGGTKDQEAEYSRLKGEYDAVQEAAVGKKCSLSPLPPVAKERVPVTVSQKNWAAAWYCGLPVS